MTLNNAYSDYARRLLSGFYLLENEKTPEEAFTRVATAFCGNNLLLANRINEALQRGWFMVSSPILSNAPEVKVNADGKVEVIKKGRGLPISCFLTYVPDTVEGLISHSEELRWMSITGGGVGGHWNDVRGVSDKSPGPIPFLKTVDADMKAYRQGKTRKGSYAAYMDDTHPDIVEFVNYRRPTGGDPDRKCLNLHHGVNVTRKFLEAIVNGEQWELICPATGEVRDTMPARQLWELLLDTRATTGEPYLNFIDDANDALPQVLKDKGRRIHGSNLCNEIHLPTSASRSAVCCLSSLNLEKFDEWKDTSLVRDLVEFLDNVIEYFLENAPDEMSRAVAGAFAERPLGIGAMGFHSYLQKNSIPYETGIAVAVGEHIFSHIKSEAVAGSKALAAIRGEAPDMIGTGLRNSHLLAVAPNANSSILLGTSPSIEVWQSNAIVQRTRAGTALVRNKYLNLIIHERYPDEVEQVWTEIEAARGSIADNERFTPHEKEVFKRAFDIDQHWVVEHAATRQPHICQGQSVNLFFPAGSERSYVNSVHLKAALSPLKGLYYYRTEAESKADNLHEKVERKALKDAEPSDCLSCEG
ncbi:ribonucleoside-diphosphate reductase subunit alpha [Bacterioplanoides sp.]|uniref:ribonucleoside-diphosphate reductase subunit alpha n=1 Tax=Bacterioplanoides sp. TaxID=2066072 RepID=UPI003AFFC37E